MSYQNTKPKPDTLLETIADYVIDSQSFNAIAIQTAQIALLDSLACAMLALKEPLCAALLGPYVPGTRVPKGARVPGTAYEMDPIKAAFDIGSCIRWLDYNDTWLSLEWGHPSDNLGGILSVSDYIDRNIHANPALKPIQRKTPILVGEILDLMIKAYEIQGILALGNSFNQLGLDHVILVKIATTAVVSKLLGFSKSQIIDALANAWVDGASLRTYRHAPNTSARKSWAAGDATRRGVELAFLVMNVKQELPSALSAKIWGFNDVFLNGQELKLVRPFESYVMENILFKVAFPAEFHAQTAVECAFKLHPLVKDRFEAIEKIELTTQEPAIRIINKEGPLYHYADRDHCLQYMVAIGLLYGELNSNHYSDEASKDPRIDALRSKMIVKEDKNYTKAYLDPDKRAIPNAVQVFFREGKSEKVEVLEPLGHQKRRAEALPLLKEKYLSAINAHFSGHQLEKLQKLWGSLDSYLEMPISKFMEFWIPN